MAWSSKNRAVRSRTAPGAGPSRWPNRGPAACGLRSIFSSRCPEKAPRKRRRPTFRCPSSGPAAWPISRAWSPSKAAPTATSRYRPRSAKSTSASWPRPTINLAAACWEPTAPERRPARFGCECAASRVRFTRGDRRTGRIALDRFGERRSQSVAHFLLRAKALALEVRLPTDSTLWSVQLDGRPCLPQRAAGSLLIPLPPAAGTVLRDLQLVYETPIAGLGGVGRLELEAPALFLRGPERRQACPSRWPTCFGTSARPPE